MRAVLLAPQHPRREHTVEERLHEGGAEEVLALLGFKPHAQRFFKRSADGGKKRTPLILTLAKQDSFPSFFKDLGGIFRVYLTDGTPFINDEVFRAFPFDTTRFTRFQHQCYDFVLQIPFGDTLTYGEVASSMGNPKAARAVGGCTAG